MGERIVVTGGAGFIGSTIIDLLLEKDDYEVVVYDDFSLGYLENLAKVEDRIKIVKGDICDYQATEKALAGAKYVFHMAALSYVGESIKKPEAYNHINIDGTLNVLKAAQANSVERFLFPSTCIVYGKTKVIPIPETEPLNPNTPYGLTKQVGEFYSKFFTEVHDVDTVCLRIFNVYGPRMQNRVLSIFANMMLQGKQPVIFGDGKQARDFVFVGDVARAFVKAMKAGKQLKGKSFNVGTGQGTDLNQLVEKVNQLLGTDIQPKYAAEATGEIETIIADTRLAEKELGFKAETDLDVGLKKTLEWLQKTNRN